MRNNYSKQQEVRRLKIGMAGLGVVFITCAAMDLYDPKRREELNASFNTTFPTLAAVISP